MVVQTSLGVEEYGFRPTLGEVPSFRLPSTLPNLPMVADISWSGKTVSYLLSLFSNIRNNRPKDAVLRCPAGIKIVTKIKVYNSVCSYSH